MSDDNPARAITAAESLGLAHTVTRHGPVHSLAEAAQARGVAPGVAVTVDAAEVVQKLDALRRRRHRPR
jgi:hypothetical protein